MKISLIIIFFQILIYTSYTQENIDSLNKVFNITNNSDSVRFDAVNCITEFYLQKRQLDSVYYYSKIHYDLATQKSNKKEIAISLNGIGNSFYWKADFLKALEYFQKSLDLSTEIGYDEGIANDYLLIGGVYMNRDRFLTGIEYIQKSLSINEKINSKLGVANCNRLLGVCYVKNNNYEKSRNYLQKGLKLYNELNNQNGIAFSIYYLGVLDFELSKYESAMAYCQKSLELWGKLGDKNGIGLSLIRIGKIKLKFGKYNEAFIDFNKALKLWEEIGDMSGLSIALNSIGEYYNKIGLYNKAIKTCKKSLDIAIKIGILIETRDACECLYKAYKNSNNNLYAISYLEKVITINDSIFNIQNTDKIAQLQMQYEFDKKESIAKSEQLIKDALSQKQLQSQIYIRNSVIVGLFILFGAFSVAFLRFREKKKLSEALIIQKNIIEEKNEEIYASITYAATIQNAILPWTSTLEDSFNEIFVFYKPKDIVSGDSYWFQEVDVIKYLAVIDCTGHGIPGAMLTVIASSVLDDAVLSKKLTDTGDILTYMNFKVTEVLNQQLEENKIRDGMEVALIAIHNNKVQFSGAGRPLYTNNGHLGIYKTDKRGIAGQTDSDIYKFSSIEIEKSNNLFLYLTSDGFADQMNESSKKYSTRRFITLLETISGLPFYEQKMSLENEFNNHKGERNQIDDITILGVRI
jgi:tetratricopeptide (TPR) repeat protein